MEARHSSWDLWEEVWDRSTEKMAPCAQGEAGTPRDKCSWHPSGLLFRLGGLCFAGKEYMQHSLYSRIWSAELRWKWDGGETSGAGGWRPPEALLISFFWSFPEFPDMHPVTNRLFSTTFRRHMRQTCHYQASISGKNNSIPSDAIVFFAFRQKWHTAFLF